MDRKDFLSILGATPFAVKALMMESPDKAKEKKVRNPDTPQCLVKDKKGNELALLTGITLSMSFDSDPLGRTTRRNWEVAFENAEEITPDHSRVIEALQNSEQVIVEIYDPNHEGLFYMGYGYFNSLNLDTYSMQVSGDIQGSELS